MKRNGARTPQSVSGHLARTRMTPNADPRRTKLNEWLVGGPDIAAAINSKLARARITRLRSDATIANDVLLSVSPSWFRPDAPDAAGTWDAKRLATFKREALSFLREQFGGRLVAAVLHLDESTPHLQAVVVPLHQKPDGGFRLSGKDLFNPTRLTALQDAWEARMGAHGVGPRVKGSKARHTTLRAYYSALAASPDLPDLSPSPPPPGRLREGRTARNERIQRWQEGEARKTRKRLQPVAAAAAKGALYEAERRAGDFLRSALSQERSIAARLRADLASSAERRQIDRAEVARLRGVPVNQVAAALGWAGEIPRRENAIDLVKRLGGLEYSQAVAWLHNAFGADAAAAAAADATRAALADSPPAHVLTKAEQIKARAITQQLDALAAPAYRITLMKEIDGKKVGQNLGKQAEGKPEQFWYRNEIIGLIPRLTAENARGGNVYVTPIDTTTHHALVDDLRADDLAALKRAGYNPALVIETSPGNHQAVVKVARADVDERAVNEWFKSINRELGDERITGLVHPMRLAGFQNRKPKYESGGHFPFVRVVEATARFCERARAVITAMADELARISPRKR
jgi:hypothetical protein